MDGERLRIASFGFRSIPPRAGSAGADKFALEFLPRLAERGHEIVGYNRIYAGETPPGPQSFRGVKVISLRTFRKSGLEAFWHAARVTYDVIRHNRADIVHMQNGGNSPFALVLRAFGKKTFVTQDGKEWERDKWSAIGQMYLRFTVLLTARAHNQVIFDNVPVKEYFESKFGGSYEFIPYGSDVTYDPAAEDVLDELGLTPGSYYLFVGRFIPDKGLHHLMPAFERLDTDKRLVMVGGSPHPSEYEQMIKGTSDKRVLFPGYVYGSRVHALMRNAYAYIQPSDIEGLSPVILESAFVGAPIICSGIEMNRRGLVEHGIYFEPGSSDDLLLKLQEAERDPEWLRERGERQRRHVTETYSWSNVVDRYIECFKTY